VQQRLKLTAFDRALSHKNFQRKDDTALNLAKDRGRALKAASRENIRQN
jgi:hypothetical protein